MSGDEFQVGNLVQCIGFFDVVRGVIVSIDEDGIIVEGRGLFDVEPKKYLFKRIC